MTALPRRSMLPKAVEAAEEVAEAVVQPSLPVAVQLSVAPQA